MRRLNAKPPAVLGHLHSIAAKAAAHMDSPPSSLFPRLSPHLKLSRGPIPAFWVSLFSAILAALILFSLACLLPARNDLRFELIIDGGSTGTRIHVFAYSVGRGGAPILDLAATSTMKENPGLSAYAREPETAGESLIPLLEFGREKVPRAQWGETKVRLMATAGLRLLDEQVQERILDSCRRALRASEFLFRPDWASVISGTDEGIYAWVAANYALGTLGGDPSDTTGIIELGGASAQITFVSDEAIPAEFMHAVKFGESTYNLYSHSFLHFGQNAAHESFRKFLSSREARSDAISFTVERFADPCTPKGYLRADQSEKSLVSTTGNFSQCQLAVRTLLKREKVDCTYKECRLGSAFVPPLDGKFLATENFFFTSKFFGLGRRAVLSDFIAVGERFCGEDWTRLRRKYYSLEEDDLLRYCFSSAYIVALLHDSLGLPLDDQRIIYANEVGSVPLDWALGSFLMLAAPPRSRIDAGNSNEISGEGSQTGSMLSVLGAAAGAVGLVGWWASRWRKPQLKTIYDLERGRYIVTRVGSTR